MDVKVFILDVDAIFKAVEMVSPPQYQWIEAVINQILDTEAPFIAPLIPDNLGVKAFVDAVFTALYDRLKGHPFLILALQAVQKIVDSYLPGAMPTLLAQGYKA